MPKPRRICSKGRKWREKHLWEVFAFKGLTKLPILGGNTGRGRVPAITGFNPKSQCLSH